MELSSIESAAGFIMAGLKEKGYECGKPEPYHFLSDRGKFVHAFLETKHKEHGKQIQYIMYKREFFHTFGKQFPNTHAGFGESMNEEVYQYLLKFQKPTMLFFAHPKAVYGCNFHTFSQYCHRKGTIRRQYNQEITVSIDARYLSKLTI
jgi:hypothetical protein